MGHIPQYHFLLMCHLQSLGVGGVAVLTPAEPRPGEWEEPAWGSCPPLPHPVSGGQMIEGPRAGTRGRECREKTVEWAG